ncbi:MAG: hypothetical protein GXO47_10495 [Chlorobi bacterium]|nr:hypothetical protein [Chlorobiota bacterium]
MQKERIYTISLFSSIILIYAGVFFKIMHYPFSDILLLSGLIFTALFIGIAFFNIINDYRKAASEKILWYTGFIIFPAFAGILYYLREIKNR